MYSCRRPSVYKVLGGNELGTSFNLRTHRLDPMKASTFTILAASVAAAAAAVVEPRATGGYVQNPSGTASFTHYSGCGSPGMCVLPYVGAVCTDDTQLVDRRQPDIPQQSTNSLLAQHQVQAQVTLAAAVLQSQPQKMCTHQHILGRKS